jgi:hypothetical protein
MSDSVTGRCPAIGIGIAVPNDLGMLRLERMVVITILDVVQ